MEKKIESFEDLRVWQRGIELVKEVYLVTGDGELKRDFGLRDQIRRAAVQYLQTLPMASRDLLVRNTCFF